MSEIPITEQFVVRPVYHRYLRRKHSMTIEPPTEMEKRDAIRVLKECYPPVLEIDELLLIEAERIFTEANVIDRELAKERES